MFHFPLSLMNRLNINETAIQVSFLNFGLVALEGRLFRIFRRNITKLNKVFFVLQERTSGELWHVYNWNKLFFIVLVVVVVFVAYTVLETLPFMKTLGRAGNFAREVSWIWWMFFHLLISKSLEIYIYL